MSLYLDLLPPPQFDRSLVTYTVANFQRIKDLFIRSSARVYQTLSYTNGPWPKTFTINHPFKADVMALYTASHFAPAIGASGTRLTLDGNYVGMWGYSFQNIAAAHMFYQGGYKGDAIAAGTHVWGIEYAANASSDSGDWGYVTLTMVEVP